MNDCRLWALSAFARAMGCKVTAQTIIRTEARDALMALDDARIENALAWLDQAVNAVRLAS